ncbi:hypothetical protein NHH03_25330 [Stieleria sp. TO1_6]|uniref:beta strand repeat-containing protein n=1 Tax=Stieleria tagensis TaxID=2956795 RepID=UPI00209AE505|nr:hypothetical protein [Stieleria tagensis]MCO8125083.1 hypothetical protein [Stieleria tagensis]
MKSSPTPTQKSTQRDPVSRHAAAQLPMAASAATRCVQNWVSQRLGKWLASLPAQSAPAQPQFFRPRLKTLEPRIVLNATAELTAAGGLLVLGDAADDFVQFDVVDSGNSIQLRDALGNIIPIAGYSGGATGSETDPLAITDITNGAVEINLGGGDDLLQIEIPDAIQLSVVDGAGDDRTEISVLPASNPSPATSLDIASDTIDLTPSGPTIQFADRNVRLAGDVLVGDSGFATRMDVGIGQFQIDGTLTLGGTVRVTGTSGSIDWTAATVSADVDQADLILDFDGSPGSSIQLGTVDDSAGHLLNQLRVSAAADVSLLGDVDLNSQLTIDAQQSLLLSGDLSAGSAQLSADQIDLTGTLQTTSGSAVLVATSQLSIEADIDTTLAGTTGNISLGGGSIQFADVSLHTDDGNVFINGPSQIDGNLQITASDVTFQGNVVSASSASGQLTIDATGGSGGGSVLLNGAVGGSAVGDANDLQSLQIAADQITVNDIGTSGVVALTAPDTQLLGSTVRAGSIDLMGDLTFHRSITSVIAADDLVISGSVQTTATTNDLSLVAGNAIGLDGDLFNGNKLSITAGSTLSAAGNLVGWNQIALDANDGIAFDGAQISATNRIDIAAAIQFVSSTAVAAAELRLDSSLEVATGQTVRVSAALVDSIGQSTITKQGSGELALLGDSALSTDLMVADGTLRVDARLGAAADVTVEQSAILTGAGEIAGAVTLRGGILAPRDDAASSDTAQLTVGSLQFDSNSIFSVDVDGSIVGQNLDSVAVAAAPIDLGSALLQLDIATPLAADTELLIVQNDSANSITGRFTIDVDANGQALATPRVLEEGALVLARFGPGGAAVPAYITYFGGDGNDVTIVTAGDHVQSVGNVTILTRVGQNLHLQDGASYAAAQADVPTIRPIAGLNGNQVQLSAIAPQAQLYVDINGFVDLSTTPLHFDSDIVFDTASAGGDASITLLDSDLSSHDAPDAFQLDYQDAQTLQLRFDHATSGAPAYDVIGNGISRLDLDLPSESLTANLSPLDDQLIATADSSVSHSNWQLTTGSLSSQLRFQHPTDTLWINAQSGDDQLTFDSLGTDFQAVPTIHGGDGTDSITWNANVAVGQSTVSRDLTFDAEQILITGDIRLIGAGDLVINAVDQLRIESTLDATSGRINIDSNAPLSDLSLGDLRSDAVSQSITLRGGDFLLGNILAADGELRLAAANPADFIGSVSQAAGTAIITADVIANSSGSLQLDSTLNTIDRVNLTADQFVTVLDSSVDLTTTIAAGGSIRVQVAGDLLLQTIQSTNGDVTLTSSENQVALASTTLPHVSGNTLDFIAGVAFPGQSISAGQIAQIGSAAAPILVAVQQQLSATTSGTSGSIYIDSAGRLPIGQIDAGRSKIKLQAESIVDSAISTDVDLIAEQIQLDAQSGIGSSNPLTLTGVSNIVARTDIGAIDLNILADRAVSLAEVTSGGGDAIRIQHSGNDRLAIGQIANQDGDVSVITQSASIDVNANTGDTIFVGGDGDLVLQTDSGNADIIVRGTVTSRGGDVDVLAQRNIVFASTGQLNSDQGDVTLGAGRQTALTSSVIDLQDGSAIDVGAGTANLQTQGDVFVSNIESTHTGDAITIQSSFGGLIDSGDNAIDLVADFGTVILQTATGIGDGNAIETQLDRLVAGVRESGAIELIESTAIELVDVSTADGRISLLSTGTITAANVRSENASSGDGVDHRDIRLETTASNADILVDQIHAENVTDVILVAADDVLQTGSGSRLIADDLNLLVLNQTADQSDAVRLTTNINDLELAVTGGNRGDVQINELDSIRLAASDRNDDTEVVSSSNGELRINAAQSISVADAMMVDDLDSLRGDVELIAGGLNGRIALIAGESITLGDAVQLQAEQSEIAAVRIESPQVVLGADFQIETGAGVAVARQFAMRPDLGLTDTAFYDATTVSTSGLLQSGSNGASGVLTVQIGNDGERGLSINLDWGAQSNRFQQIDGLSGDADPLQVQHLYTEQDILTSRLNGRSSATDPLEVRFAVRHHESILVVGDTIQQDSSPTESVAGRLLSSTDNPLTQQGPSVPILENGQARFIIPALSIPVAFFPVRDVIPQIEQAQVVMAPQQSFVLLGTGFDSIEAVSSTTTGREEYYRIRILSPDPDGDDLAEPMQLPDDIVGEEKLTKLFQTLPDGRYEIQHVLGDGNIHSLVTVELRDGQPLSADDDFDGGALELEEVDADGNPVEPGADPIPMNPEVNQSSSIRMDSTDSPVAETVEPAPQPPPLSVAGRFRARLLPESTRDPIAGSEGATTR